MTKLETARPVGTIKAVTPRYAGAPLGNYSMEGGCKSSTARCVGSRRSPSAGTKQNHADLSDERPARSMWRRHHERHAEAERSSTHRAVGLGSVDAGRDDAVRFRAAVRHLNRSIS